MCELGKLLQQSEAINQWVNYNDADSSHFDLIGVQQGFYYIYFPFYLKENSTLFAWTYHLEVLFPFIAFDTLPTEWKMIENEKMTKTLFLMQFSAIENANFLSFNTYIQLN